MTKLTNRKILINYQTVSCSRSLPWIYFPFCHITSWLAIPSFHHSLNLLDNLSTFSFPFHIPSLIPTFVLFLKSHRGNQEIVSVYIFLRLLQFFHLPSFLHPPLHPPSPLHSKGLSTSSESLLFLSLLSLVLRLRSITAFLLSSVNVCFSHCLLGIHHVARWAHLYFIQ